MCNKTIWRVLTSQKAADPATFLLLSLLCSNGEKICKKNSWIGIEIECFAVIETHHSPKSYLAIYAEFPRSNNSKICMKIQSVDFMHSCSEKAESEEEESRTPRTLRIGTSQFDDQNE